MHSILMTSCLCVVLASSAAAFDRAVEPQLEPALGELLYSTSTTGRLAVRETAGPDSFVLYGGPGVPLEGKFEDGVGAPSLNGWTTVDLTYDEIYWQVSTFGADNLGESGNHAYWCGQDAAQQPGWASPPGYGNNWTQDLIWESGAVADPSIGQVVTLDFVYNVDTEPGYDLFTVAYETASGWQEVFFDDGLALGQTYSLQPALPVSYGPNDYAGEAGNLIRIRLRFESDVLYSDEDGLLPTGQGAVQIDNFSVSWSGGEGFEDFEGPGPWLLQPRRQPFAGDFASVLTLLTDIDPCVDDATPGAAFIDYDQAPINGPGVDGKVSTGGSTAPDVDYGIPGFYTVNATGGISPDGELVPVENAVVSPPIAWDHPLAGDEGPDFVGAILAFDVWDHLPFANGIVRTWHVRSKVAGQWEKWENRGTFYLSDQPVWRRVEVPVGELLFAEGVPESVQVRLGVRDLSHTWYPMIENTATPSPVYDNVVLKKYRVGGPAIAALDVHLANDAFPSLTTGLASSTPEERDLLDVRFDMAKDIMPEGTNALVPGDSLVCEVTSMIPGAAVTDIRMHWALAKNTFFEDLLRTLPSRPQDENTSAGPALWSGEVVADSCRIAISGLPIPGRYFFDLPDSDLIYPGDVVHYYFEATDSDGRVTTLPTDTSAFSDFGETTIWDRRFTMRGLPSLDPERHPPTLVVNDAPSGTERAFLYSLRELGHYEGQHFDTYRVQAAGSRISNGIGASAGHGPYPAQVAGYENILYLSGNLLLTLSDGQLASFSDKADDLGLIEAWEALPGTRRIAYFGDSIAQNLVQSLLGSNFLSGKIGASYMGPDVAPEIDDDVSPRVLPQVDGFVSEYIANGGCPVYADMDAIRENPEGETTHRFVDGSENPWLDVSAAVRKSHPDGFHILFPYGLERVESTYGRRILPSPRALLLQNIFGLESICATQPCTGAPARRPVTLRVSPNPFNPRTVVEFTAPEGAKGSVRVFNLRGELVRVLHDGEFARTEFVWDGRDRRGASVASGVYVVRAEAAGRTLTKKVALVR